MTLKQYLDNLIMTDNVRAINNPNAIVGTLMPDGTYAKHGTIKSKFTQNPLIKKRKRKVLYKLMQMRPIPNIISNNDK